jgi:hypothetical protein
MTTGCPKTLLIGSAIDRQTTVFTPPATNGTINFIARVGYAWPLAGQASKSKMNRKRKLNPIPFHLRMIIG